MRQLTHSLIQIIWGLLWLFHWLHFWTPYLYTEIKGRIWHPNLHMNTPLYLKFHAVLCNLLLNHHINITTVNILVVGVSTVLPNRLAHNGECYMKSSSSEFALVEKINSFVIEKKIIKLYGNKRSIKKPKHFKTKPCMVFWDILMLTRTVDTYSDI